MPEYLGSKDRSGSYASKSDNMRRAASFRRVRVCLLLLFFLPENADDLLDRILWLLLLWLLVCSLAPFCPSMPPKIPDTADEGLLEFGRRPLSFICPICLRSGANLGFWPVPVTVAGMTSSPWLLASAVFMKPPMPAAPPSLSVNAFESTAVMRKLRAWVARSAVPVTPMLPIIEQGLQIVGLSHAALHQDVTGHLQNIREPPIGLI